MVSRLAAIQARFQEKQLQEKEEKLLRLYESQQQRTMDRINKGSPNGMSNVSTKVNYSTSSHSFAATGTGKVRQMFDERRQKAGIDRSYPLEPLKAKPPNGYLRPTAGTKQGSFGKTKSNGDTSVQSTVKASVQKSVYKSQNGKVVTNKRDIVRAVYNNNNGDETFEEERYSENNNPVPDKISHSFEALANRMDNMHINDSLDNQKLPDVGIEKRENSGGNEDYHMKNETTARKLVPASKKEVKPLVKKVVTKVRKANSNSIGECSILTTTPGQLPSSEFYSSPTEQSYSNTPSRRSPTNRSVSSQSSGVQSPQRGGSSMSQTARNKLSSDQKVPSMARPSGKPRQQPSAIVRDDLEPCKYCGRRFAADRLIVHEDICARAGKKKRKAYDATKHRIQGTELEPYVRKKKTGKVATKAIPQPDWRKKHEEFISTIRAAKVAQAHLAKGGKISDLPPPPPSYNPDYVQCPHCGRRFNESAAERHIPKCATYQFNKPKPKPPGTGKSSIRTSR